MSEATHEGPVRILAIGGSTRPDSSSERALLAAVRGATDHGAEVKTIVGRSLMLPIYDTETEERTELAQELVAAYRWADGLLVASPGYHGGISGMMKNALDYVEDLRADERVYLHGIAVGCIAVAYGWQATASTMHQLRQVAHAVRAWPTPLGCTVNASVTKFDSEGHCDDRGAEASLEMVGHQVVEFAQMRRALDKIN
ncbi:MAG: NADPH-dependent FMN reductase [Actinomycetes bacterium]|jgi:FMN reductase|nr:NAD(P)H-dependent oxidoreductase [Candidatus Nanopelagicales bacterium]MDP4888649.1 NAD(P)H-dependent oxidoreductase [Candidatus Nanopelagicales bacterium]